MSETNLMDAVRRALLLMAETLANPKPVTAELIHAWVLVLKRNGYGPEEVEAGVGRILETSTFFPTPADFLNALRPPKVDVDAQAELAWGHVRHAVREYGANASLCVEDFGGDGTALWALTQMGYGELCRELTEENRAIFRAEFVRIYRSALESGLRRDYFTGAHERQNLTLGREMTPTLCGRPDWPALPASRQTKEALLPSVAALVRSLSEEPEMTLVER